MCIRDSLTTHWSSYYKHGTTITVYQTIHNFKPLPHYIPISVHTLDNGTNHCQIIQIDSFQSPPPPSNWSDFIKTQPIWTQEMLGGIFYDDITTVISELQTNSDIIAVSDGSVRNSLMTYGWVLSTTKGKRFATGYGPAHGRPSSLRSEANGMLAVATFLCMIQQFTNYTFKPLQVNFFADNLSLIKRMNIRQTFKTPYTNMTLQPEYDLTEQIHRQLIAHHIQPTFNHVKGHQDDTNAKSKLPLPAQLNIEADLLATQFYKEGAPSTPYASTLPASKIQLDIQNITVTNDFQNQLIRAYTEPLYLSYLQKKNKWSDFTITQISWNSLKIALNRLQRPVLLTKICNDLLPTAYVLKRQQFHNKDSCPLCGAQETTQHLFQCQHPRRIKWKRKFISDLRKLLKHMHTQLQLTETLCQAITCWLDSKPIEISDYPQAHQDAVAAQTLIGWPQLFQGKLSQSWEIIQGNHRSKSGVNRPSYLWAANIVTLILQHSIILWEERNEQFHGTNEEQKTQHLLEHYRFIIKDLLSKKPLCLAKDRDIFPDDPTQLLEQTSPTRLAEWIASRKPTILNSIKQAKKQDISNNQSILQWVTSALSNKASKFMSWKRDRLLHDPYSKKKKHKQHTNPITATTQQQITKYLTLNSTFPP